MAGLGRRGCRSLAAKPGAVVGVPGGGGWSAAALGSKRYFSVKERARKTVHRPFETQMPYHKEVLEASPETLMQAQMYTPEALKAEGLTRNCHRMVAWGLAVPELLDRYGDRAAALGATLTPTQFSVVLNAFARAEHRHEKMLKVFTKRMPPRLPHFVPMDFSQICNAYAKLREQEDSLFRRFSSEMPHKLPLFSGFQLGLVANAYARLSIKDELLFDDIADEVIRRPHELNHVALLNVANAYGHFRIRSHRLWLVLSDWLLHSYLDLTAQDIANLLNAMSAVDFKHDALLRTLTGCLCEPHILEEMQPSALGLAVNALARLRWFGPGGREAVQALGEQAASQDCLQGMSPSGITQMLHACGKLEDLRANQALVDGLLGRAREKVLDFNPQSLSLLINTCTKLRLRDVPLLTQVAKAVTPGVSTFNPQALAMIAHGFAKLEVRSEILFYLLAGEIVEKMPLFTGQGVGMVLSAYAKLDIKNDKLVQSCRKQARALADELSLQEAAAVEAGLRALGGLDGASEAFFRKIRRRLQEEQGAGSPLATSSGSSAAGGSGAAARGQEADPFLADAGDFLGRLAEAAPDTAAVSAVSAAAPSSSSPPEDGGGGSRERPWPEEAAEEEGGGRARREKERGQEEADADPDLWSLWDVPGSSSSSSSSASRREAARTSDDSIWVIGRPASSPGTPMSTMPPSEDDATAPSQLREYLSKQHRPGRQPVVLDRHKDPEAREAHEAEEPGRGRRGARGRRRGEPRGERGWNEGEE